MRSGRYAIRSTKTETSIVNKMANRRARGIEFEVGDGIKGAECANHHHASNAQFVKLNTLYTSA